MAPNSNASHRVLVLVVMARGAVAVVVEEVWGGGALGHCGRGEGAQAPTLPLLLAVTPADQGGPRAGSSVVVVIVVNLEKTKRIK